MNLCRHDEVLRQSTGRHCEQSEAIQRFVVGEVKQSSGFRHKDTALSGLPRRFRLLMERLAIRLSQQAGKSLVIAMTVYYGEARAVIANKVWE